MNRKVSLITSCALILLVALISRNGILLLLLPALLIRFHQAANRDDYDFEVTRNIQEKRLHKNGETDVEVNIINKGRDIGRIRIIEKPPSSMEIISGKTTCFSTMKKDAVITLKYRVKCRRGRHRFLPLRISLWNHFGLNPMDFEFENDDEIIALPDSVQLGSFPINVRKTLVFAGMNPSGQGGDGVYFHDIREYQSGDSLRHIHWSAVARKPEKLITKEFEQERVSDIGIILDARQDSYEQYGNSTHIELGIEAVSALSEILLSLQNRVGLMVYGKYLNWTMPGYGKMQGEKIRRALAVTETGNHHVFKSLRNLPANLFPERSQLIFISPIIKSDIGFLKSLKGRGYMIIIICLDSLSLREHNIDPLVTDLAQIERELMIRNLERSGITVLKWNLNDTIENLILMNRGKLRMAVREGLALLAILTVWFISARITAAIGFWPLAAVILILIITLSSYSSDLF